MANPPRTRKRVRANRRAHDGSAFEECSSCGLLVAIALNDMHECPPKKELKKFADQRGTHKIQKQSFYDQPRSAFRFFMEGFMETCKDEKGIDIDRKGFETWKNMSMEERETYVIEAEKVNSAYHEAQLRELDHNAEEDDEADSAMVGKFDKFYEDCIVWENSDSFESGWYKRIDSFNTFDWKIECSWGCH